MYTYLNNNFSFSERDLKITIPILSALVYFIIYWFIAQSVIIKKMFYLKFDHDRASYRHILFTKFTGLVVMGILPALTCIMMIPDFDLASIGLCFNSSTWFFSLVWISALSLIVVPIAYFSARKPKNWVNYPQIRARYWSNRMLVMNGLGWFIYLFGYEFLFRGVLLFPLVEELGIWPAIALNIALYSATHIPKGLDETLGAIPLGLVLCILTISSGTIWIALFVHVVMAWTNSYTSFYFNPLTNHESTRNK